MTTIWRARQYAAQAWCDPETSGTLMDPVLCEAFARRLEVLIELGDELADLVVWMSGSDDFSTTGPAGVAWAKRRETLDRAVRFLANPADPKAREASFSPTPTAAPPSPAEGEREAWVIECRRTGSDEALFWGPNRSGYTTDLSKAGRYSEEEARRQAKSRPDVDVPHRLADVRPLARPTVDRDTLRRAASPRPPSTEAPCGGWYCWQTPDRTAWVHCLSSGRTCSELKTDRPPDATAPAPSAGGETACEECGDGLFIGSTTLGTLRLCQKCAPQTDEGAACPACGKDLGVPGPPGFVGRIAAKTFCRHCGWGRPGTAP